MGFLVVMQRLGTIQQRLEETQEALRLLDHKVELSFYSNLCAALDLATNAFTMVKPANRKASAMQAVNRFLEAERHYADLFDLELGRGSRVADEYLLTLALVYVTEVRCYLEPEELGTAQRRLGDGLAHLRPRFEQLVRVLLTSNPAAYSHPALKGRIKLRRLTRVYQWLQPDLDENSVFEAQRDNLFALARQPEAWISSLPPAFLVTKKGRFSKLRDALPSLSKRLPARSSTDESAVEDSGTPFDDPEMLALIEQLIESERRFETYGTEVEATRQLGMSFQCWQELAPASADQTNGSNLVYILPTEEVKLTARVS